MSKHNVKIPILADTGKFCFTPTNIMLQIPFCSDRYSLPIYENDGEH